VQILRHSNSRCVELINLNGFKESRIRVVKKLMNKVRVLINKHLNPGTLEPSSPVTFEVIMMKRRDFLRMLLFGAIFSLFGKHVKAGKKPDTIRLKEAMFWRKIDNE
jgi:hypothetical protein